jgi:hypothetical protein
MRRTRFATGVLAIAFLGAMLAGCGSDDKKAAGGDSSETTRTTPTGVSSLEDWADGLCTSVAEWQSSVKSTAASMAASKSDFAQGEQAVTSADNFLVSGLKGIGTPPAPASTDAKNAFDQLLTNLENDAGDIQQALLTEPRTQSEVETATARVKTLLTGMNSDIARTVTELKALPDTEGWKAAFKKIPRCHAVAAG